MRSLCSVIVPLVRRSFRLPTYGRARAPCVHGLDFSFPTRHRPPHSATTRPKQCQQQEHDLSRDRRSSICVAHRREEEGPHKRAAKHSGETAEEDKRLGPLAGLLLPRMVDLELQFRCSSFRSGLDELANVLVDRGAISNACRLTNSLKVVLTESPGVGVVHRPQQSVGSAKRVHEPVALAQRPDGPPMHEDRQQSVDLRRPARLRHPRPRAAVAAPSVHEQHLLLGQHDVATVVPGDPALRPGGPAWGQDDSGACSGCWHDRRHRDRSRVVKDIGLALSLGRQPDLRAGRAVVPTLLKGHTTIIVAPPG